MKSFLLADAQDHVSDAALRRGMRLAPEASVLVVVRGMILAHTFPVCFTSRPVVFNQDVKAVIAKSGVHPKFLGHWFICQADRLLRLVTEATHGTKRIDLKDLIQYPIALPDPAEQRRIAEILDSLDDAIRETEQVIAKLDQMRQGLLHDLLTRGIDENGEVRDPGRHPRGFRHSAIGRIPGSWSVDPVSAAGSVQLGKALGSGSACGMVPRPYLRVANVFDGWIDYSDVNIMPFSRSEGDVFRLEAGDILLNEGQSLELVGRSALYDGVPGQYCFQNSLIRFRPKAGVSLPEYCAAVFSRWLHTGAFQRVALRTTSVAHLGADRLAQMLFPRPPLEEQVRIADRLRVARDRIVAERAARDKLELVRLGLADDLLTGRVRVKAPGEAGHERPRVREV